MGTDASQWVFARALTDPDAALPPGVIGSAARFNIHRNNIIASLTAVLALGLALLHPPRVYAQTLYGSVVGTVNDAQGAGIPGATITVRNRDTNLTRDTVSSGDGSSCVRTRTVSPCE